MACPAVTTGQGFLVETLGHLDCQAQAIGSYGFQSLANPSSPAASLMSALLTIFVALFGIRLLFGDRVGSRDAVGSVIKIGIVLTLALSWPAWRVLAYDTVLHGPAEIAATMGGETLPDLGGGLAQRLQRMDDGMIALTQVGAGRQTGALEVPGEERGSFQGIALQDEAGFGYGRTVFLGATIGSLGLLRIAAALLLAIAPLIAGLLLFDQTRGIFAGWLRGLFLTALGSLGISLLLGVQVAVMEPWLADAVNRRNLGYATPGAPTELFALSLGFAIAGFALLALLARVAFQNSWPSLSPIMPGRREAERENERQVPLRTGNREGQSHSRALVVSEGVMATIQRERGAGDQGDSRRTVNMPPASRGSGQTETGGWHGRQAPLGSSYRRTATRRITGSRERRDRGA